MKSALSLLSTRVRAARPLAALLVVPFTLACQSTTTTNGAPANGAASESTARTTESTARTTESTARTTESTAADRLEATMVIGPAAARELGYRVIWEVDGLVSRGADLAQVFPVGDTIFTVDSRNLLCRVRTNDGARVWGSPVASATDRVFGLLRIESSDEDRIYLTTEGSVWVIESATGVPIDRHRLARVANTASILSGGRLVYGTRSGQVVWLDRVVGHPWRVRQGTGPIRSAPLVIGNDLAVATGGGDVVVLEANSADPVWQKKLLAGVTAGLAGGGNVVFVAGLDQYLWAFDQSSGRTLWRTFSDAPLTTAPVLLGDRLYQRFASTGLTCFDAFPNDAPDGRALWTNADVRGEVLGMRGRHLLVWDATGRRLSALDPARGTLVTAVDLPRADMLVVTTPENGDLLALNRDGRLIRLAPQ